MVLHLEAGTCESGTDADRVIDIALDFHQWRKYIYDDNDVAAFQCPTCDMLFTLMSGLLQHVESDCCDESLAKGNILARFLLFLRSRIY